MFVHAVLLPCYIFMIIIFLIVQSERLHKVLEFVSTVHDLCGVLGMDFLTTVTEVHPSLNDSRGTQSKSISDDTLSRLAKTVLTLKEDKKTRLHKVITRSPTWFSDGRKRSQQKSLPYFCITTDSWRLEAQFMSQIFSD